MKPLAPSILLLAAASAVAAPAPLPKGVKPSEREELARLQGDWEVVCEELWGADGCGEVAHPERWTVSFRGACLRRYFGGDLRLEQAVRLDPARTPRALDLACLDSEVDSRGVYKLEGDALIICTANGEARRPATVTGGLDGQKVLILRRKGPRPGEEGRRARTQAPAP
jgi:uncharacterized protein (TIGR03067 family)